MMCLMTCRKSWSKAGECVEPTPVSYLVVCFDAVAHLLQMVAVVGQHCLVVSGQRVEIGFLAVDMVKGVGTGERVVSEDLVEENKYDEGPSMHE